MSHLFITRANLAHLACDAWLLPTDARCHITRSWLRSLSGRERQLADDAQPTGRQLDREAHRVEPLDPKHLLSRAWLTNVGSHPGRGLDWYIEGVRQFLDAVDEWLGAAPEPLHRRERPIVGVPLVGTGYGGAADVKGALTQGLLAMLASEATARRFDIVLVTFDARMLAAAQQTRRDQLPGVQAWPELDARLLAAASGLANRALRGELVLFVGAGVSAGAGLPTWRELLDTIAVEANVSDSDRGRTTTGGS